MKLRTLITGGAGFVGCNLASNLLRDGFSVTILDACLRRGADANLAWLRINPGSGRLRVIKEDIRNFEAVQAALKDVDIVYHLASQVAVTSSVMDPRTDFEINALGTLNVLEAARLTARPPAVIFTSTNKVYGALTDIQTIEGASGYCLRDYPVGISEQQSLDFHSPYGCSKGAADQYVRDYARIYGIPTVVFRMSCIYGPRQFGTEDQGWVAHFIISALTGRPITIYGDGKQVRDVLFVDDLVRALRLAADKIDVVAGEVFNIGGGPANTLSIWTEFGEILQQFIGAAIAVRYDKWRPGDQPCYVSAIQKAGDLLGWAPLIDKQTGIRKLAEWASANLKLFSQSHEPYRDERIRQARRNVAGATP
jgi:CDP-paratose 2-epimerase